MVTITAARLRDVIQYNPDTGVLTWIKPRRHMALGSIAGTPDTYGYVRVGIDGRQYRGHCLAWLWMSGEWPSRQIDHINRQRDDNRWENLRLATNAQNQFNTGLSPRNTSGFKGVSWRGDKKRWVARIEVNGRAVHLGYYRDASAAHIAYIEAAKRFFGEYARAG